MSRRDRNTDDATVTGFGFEWTHFDQRSASPAELQKYFDQYFAIFPWDSLPPNPSGFDLGCGSGRWARLVSSRVGTLHCIDASSAAIEAAKRLLADVPNCRFHVASVDEIPLGAGSQDFGYSLGVLHHVPDTAAGLRACASKLRPGAPFLVYLYYSLENRSFAYRAAWLLSDVIRRLVSRLPLNARRFVTTLLALAVYWPLARIARTLAHLRIATDRFPLAFYKDASLLTMRTDSFDRFATRLERRFRSAEVISLLEESGFRDVRLSPEPPYWCAVGIRSNETSTT